VDDGYDGPARIDSDGTIIAVQVQLTGQFEPITGSYHWYGRVAASADLEPLLGRRVVLRTPQGSAETTLSDVDPWGRPRVAGFGTAPFEVATSLP
jgi:hypothetical protein